MNITTKTSLDDTRLKVLVNTELEYNANKTLYKKLGVSTETTKEKGKMTSDLTAPKKMTLVPENGLSPAKDIVQGFTSTIFWNEYHLANQISYQAMKTDLNNDMIELARSSSKYVGKQHDYKFGQLFRTAFTPSIRHADGVSLISTLHPLKSAGGTQANTFVDTQKAFSYQTLLEATDILNNMRNHVNEKIVRNPRYTILIPQASQLLETVFQTVIGNSWKPSSPNRDANFFTEYQGVEYDLIVSDALTKAVANQEDFVTPAFLDTSWFLIDTDMIKKSFMRVVLIDSEVVIRETEERNLSKNFDLFSFFGFGSTSIAPMAIFGSKGDGTVTDI